jgi:hypothetical protein
MAGKKYVKYFIQGQSPTIRRCLGPTQILLDDSIIKRSNFYWALIMPEMETPTMAVRHPSHILKDAELLFHVPFKRFFIGTMILLLVTVFFELIPLKFRGIMIYA